MKSFLALWTYLLSLLSAASPLPTTYPTTHYFPPPATPTPVVAYLQVLQGSAKLDKSLTIKSLDTASLSAGQTIVTSANSLAQIDFQSDTLARLGPNTSLSYTSPSSLTQNLGKIYVRFKAVLGIRDAFTVTTPTAVASVRGTAFSLFVTSAKLSKLVAHDHPVVFQSLASSASATLIMGQQGIIQPGKPGVATSEAKLTFDEQNWVDFNSQADLATDVLSVYQTIQARPTPTPTITPTPAGPPVLQGPPSSGLSSVTVPTSRGNFRTTILSVDLASSKMVTDSLEESNCTANCKTTSLQDYVARNGGYAGIHGTYFCPASYPDCVDKKDSWDFPIFNTRLHRWIPDNTLSWGGRSVLYVDGGGAQYNQNSAGIGGSMDAGIINFPGLIDSGGNVQIDDNQSGASAKQAAVGTKFGIGRLDSSHIIVVVAYNVNMRDFAEVFKAIGAHGGVNLDSGGSAALYYNGHYAIGPGRNIPNAIIFVRK